MKKFIKIILVMTIIGVLIHFNGGLASFFKSQTAYAVGDLTVDWGVPANQPIFSITNASPGQIETRTVLVTNGAPSPRPVGVRGIKTNETNNVSEALNFTIKEGATDLYGGSSSTGPKTLAQFFSESATISGIALSTIPQNGSTHYSFVVTFDQNAGNSFQNSNITFDLEMGVFFEVPTACQNINFTGQTIFGTSGNDHLTGTNKNDMIVSFDGNDTIDGGNGADCIVSGNGQNIISGGNNNDIITNGSGNSWIDGGNGDDKITSGNGNNTLHGGNDSDQITVGNGNNTIDSGNGKDQVNTGSGSNKINGGNGADLLTTAGNTSFTDGGNGQDTCISHSKINCEL